jgi:hypothetical protein
MSRQSPGEYGFEEVIGPHKKASYNSIAKTVGRKSSKRLKKEGSLEIFLRKKKEATQNFLNKTGRLSPLVRASMNPIEPFKSNKGSERFTLYKNTGINVGGTRKRYKKRRLSRKVKKTYRKRR